MEEDEGETNPPPLELVGTLPPSLKELVLPKEHRVDIQPSLIPKGCTVRRESDKYFSDVLGK
jgi:hypothetical protein